MPDGPFLLGEEEQDEENRAQLAAFAAGQPDSPEPKPRLGRRPPQPFATRPVEPMTMHPYQMDMARAGFEAHGKAIQNTNDAIRDEMDSRVSQEREYRRMMHEQEIERMRQETERMKIEALLKRLQMESAGPRRLQPMPYV